MSLSISPATHSPPMPVFRGFQLRFLVEEGVTHALILFCCGVRLDRQYGAAAVAEAPPVQAAKASSESGTPQVIGDCVVACSPPSAGHTSCMTSRTLDSKKQQRSVGAFLIGAVGIALRSSYMTLTAFKSRLVIRCRVGGRVVQVKRTTPAGHCYDAQVRWAGALTTATCNSN